MRIVGCFAATCVALASSGCKEDVPLHTSIVGKWVNVDRGEDSIEFRDDGSLVVSGQTKRDAIGGRYVLLNDENIEMTFRFQDGNEWRPRWMPPGVRRSPIVRSYVRFFGEVLELRPRGRIQAKDFDQFIEFGAIRFDRVEDETPVVE